MTDETKAALARAFCLTMEMWSRRHEVGVENLPPPESPFEGTPAVVDLGLLTSAHTDLMTAAQELLPEIYEQLTQNGGVPDAPLPPPEEGVVDLDLHRIRVAEEFKDEQVAYLEVLWGKNTFAFNVAVRDLELMRRGRDNGTLREPGTYYEAQHMVLHVRALANDLARHFSMPDMVRADDDLHVRGGDQGRQITDECSLGGPEEPGE